MKNIARFKVSEMWSLLLSGDNIKIKLLCLVGIVVFIITFGMGVAFFIFNFTPDEALWWSWTHILDAGFLGDDKESLSRRIWGSFFSVFGLVLLGGAFITLSEEAARRAVDRLMQGSIQKKISKHTIIAGKGSKLKSFIVSLKKLSSWRSGEKLLIVTPSQESLLQARKECEHEHNDTFVVDQIWEDTKNRLGLGEARRVILLDNFGGDTGAMLKTILKIQQMRKGKAHRQQNLTLYAEVNDRSLANGLRAVLGEINEKDLCMEIHILNISDSSARLALRQYPLDCEPINSDAPLVVTLLLEGWTPFAQALFWQAIRVAHYPSKPTRIIVVHPDAESIAAEVRSIAPGLGDPWCLEQLVKIQFVKAYSQQELSISAEHIVTLAVCDADADKVFSRALHYRDATIPGLKQIFVELPDSSGYREALQFMSSSIRKIPLCLVGASAEAFELAEKLDGDAKLLHTRYLEQRENQKKRKSLPGGRYESKSDYEWNELDEVIRSWNRASADHIEVKLRALCDFNHLKERPTYDPTKDSFHCSDELVAVMQKIVDNWSSDSQGGQPDLELLSQIEHDRWSAEKIAEGWSFAESKNESKKHSPYIQPYEQLTEEIKGYDRETVIKMLKAKLPNSNELSKKI